MPVKALHASHAYGYPRRAGSGYFILPEVMLTLLFDRSVTIIDPISECEGTAGTTP